MRVVHFILSDCVPTLKVRISELMNFSCFRLVLPGSITQSLMGVVVSTHVYPKMKHGT